MLTETQAQRLAEMVVANVGPGLLSDAEGSAMIAGLQTLIRREEEARKINARLHDDISKKITECELQATVIAEQSAELESLKALNEKMGQQNKNLAQKVVDLLGDKKAQAKLLEDAKVALPELVAKSIGDRLIEHLDKRIHLERPPQHTGFFTLPADNPQGNQSVSDTAKE